MFAGRLAVRLHVRCRTNMMPCSSTINSFVPSVAHSSSASNSPAQFHYPSPVSQLEIDESNQLIRHVNQHLFKDAGRLPPRLFAVVYFCGRQYKVTENDLLVVEHNRQFDVGDRLRLPKVLMVGGEDFSLVGRPLLPADSVVVEATVVEKTLSNTEPDFDYIPKKTFRMLTFIRNEVNLLRVNRIELQTPLHEITTG